MMVKCVCNEGFEDSLTKDERYFFIALKGGSVMVTDDKMRKRWFGLSRFEFLY